MKTDDPLPAQPRPEADQPRACLDDHVAGEWAVHFDDKQPEDLLEWALERFVPRLAVVTSLQVDDLVLLDMAWHLNPKIRAITVDTGRLHPETYEVTDRVRDKYGIELEVLFPDHGAVEAMVRRHGVNLFYRSVNNRLLCCHVRKSLALNRALLTVDAWITGLRRDQWATRGNIRKMDLDHDHGGIVKLNPLADWTHDEVWDYVRKFDVPVNPLYEQGYPSIGCAPCTRTVKPGEDARAGRWWWETNAPKECGIHCAIETGSFEHEVEMIRGAAAQGEETAGTSNGQRSWLGTRWTGVAPVWN